MAGELMVLLGVVLGFYLGRFSEINSKIKEKIEEINKPKGYGTPFVVSTDEVALEKEQKAEEKEKIFLEDILPK